MAESYIDGVIRRICNREGDKFTNDPVDEGGATKYGITQSTLSRWLKRQATVQEVKNLTLQEASRIYKVMFIEAPGFLQFGESLAEQIMDAGVNHGTSKAVQLLQRGLGVPDDGKIGPQTLQAFQSTLEWKVFTGFMAARLQFYADIIKAKPVQKRFAAGWMNRCAEMIDIYVKAVEIDHVIEGKMLAVAQLARKQARDIQASQAIRAQSASLFEILATNVRRI